MVNLKSMIPGRLYINRYSGSSRVYKKGKAGLIWYRGTSPKTNWKLSEASMKLKNYVLCTDYGYEKDIDIMTPGVSKIPFLPIKMNIGVISFPV